MLDQLMIAREGLETLLALVWLDLRPPQAPLSSQLHRRLRHQVLGAAGNKGQTYSHKPSTIHCKKWFAIFPSPAGKPNSLWPGIIKLFPARECLESDIPAGDGKIGNLFYSVGKS